MIRILSLCLIAIAAMGLSAGGEEPDFERDIAPLIAKRCLGCHNGRDAKSELDLTSRAAVLKGGESGSVIVAGKPEDSLLIDRVSAGEMPPELRGISQKLPEKEIELLRRWIASGAQWPDGRTLGIYEKTTDVRAGLDWWSFAAEPAFGKQPNIILIFTDDQGYQDVGCFGSTKIKTPHLDQMAADGLRLTSFYAQPVCGVSRAALMTGSYPIRVGEPGNEKRLHTVPHPNETTMAEVMKSNGYTTGIIGKWHLTLKKAGAPGGFDPATLAVTINQATGVVDPVFLAP